MKQTNQLSVGIPDGIERLLQEKLVHPSDGLQGMYRWIGDCFGEQYHGKPAVVPAAPELRTGDLKGSFAETCKSGVRNVGIDFPVLMSKGTGRPVLMICALDPNRDNVKDGSDQGIVGSWVPFSIVNNPEKINNGKEQNNLLFFHTLLASYDLYLTDVYKVFYRDQNTGKVSNQIPAYTVIPDHRALLEEEIRLVKPAALLTLGRAARAAVGRIHGLQMPNRFEDRIQKVQADSGLPILPVPHISATANGAKYSILNNPDYAEIPGGHNVKYANIILQSLRG